MLRQRLKTLMFRASFPDIIIIGGGRCQWLGGGHHGECGARAYNGGLGAEPPAGSRGRAPGYGVRGRSPPEAESILVIGCPTEPANLASFQKCLFELRYTKQSA